MVNSISQSSLLALSALMKQTAARQAVQVSVINKAQELEKMQGEAALKLIDSASNGTSSGRIDVHA